MRNITQWLLLFCLLVGGGVCLAQNTNSGDIRGTVTDPTGAVVPGVTVTAKDVDKGVTRTYTTDGAGLYDTGPIVPDHYLITFKRDGFESYVRGPITLGVGVDTVNAQLKIGSTSQQVVVNTDLPLLTTESGAQEGTLEASNMADLPQSGGADWENFVILMPGASGTPENSSNSLNPGQITSINGNLPFQSMLADGAVTSLPMSQNADVTIFETTAEVKISATGFSAQYGVGDIVYNQITKSGSDKFHGSAYLYNQNNIFNAAPYGFGNKMAVPIHHYNNFGGSVGGPVLPFKHKAFFFFDYDRTINNGGANNGNLTVPTDAMKGGDFSAPGFHTLYDPTSQVLVTSGTCTINGVVVPAPCVQRTAFQDETKYGGDGTHATNKIPAGMIASASKAIQAYYPKANADGTLTPGGYYKDNYIYNVPSADPFIKWFGRLDYDITPSNRLTISETESDNPATYLNEGLCPINCQSGDVSRDNAQVSDVWTFSSHLINEARLGFTDQMNYYVPFGIGDGWPTKLNMPMLIADNFPSIGLNNFHTLASASNSVYKEFVFDPSDVVTLIKGRHILHFGGEFLINRADSTAWGNLNAGSINFDGRYTSSGGKDYIGGSGLDYADFLLGQVNNWSASETPEFGGRWKTPQMFVQDDWKFRPNLTINLGLRYEIETGWREVKGNEKVFDPAVVSKDVTNAATYGQVVQGGMWYGFLGQNGRTTLQAPKYDIVLPRLGFSWQPKSNLVVRGGIGLYASTWSEDTYGGGMGGASGSSGGYGDSTNGMCPVVEIGADGKTADTTDPGCGTGSFNGVSIMSTYLTAPTDPWAGQGLNQSATYNQYHTPVPKNYQWSFGVQREFAKDFLAEVTYVGNHGVNLNFPVDIDQVPQSKLGPDDQKDQPYPLYNQISGSTNNAISNYHALQGTLTKRMSYGIQFSVNYTWSHFLDDLDSSGWGSREGWQNYQNAYKPAENYSQSNYDIRHMFKGMAVYKLPFGRGAMFMNKSIIADEVLGGWQISSIFMAQGGNPMGATTGWNNNSENRSGDYTQEAILVGDYKTGGHKISNWYNEAAFHQPLQYHYGTFRRNTITGPGLVNANASFGKAFDIWTEHNVKFNIRADASNIFNHPSFSQPGGVVGSIYNQKTGAWDSNGQTSNITGVTVSGRSFQFYGHLTF